jgi:purine-binding chemotaxis protein CheW
MDRTDAPENSAAGRNCRGDDAERGHDRISAGNADCVPGMSDSVSPECHATEKLKVVVFRLADHEHAVDVRQVREILINTPVSHVLEAPDFVEGVIKLRGRIVPVIDLRKRLRLPAIRKSRESCIIVVRFNQKTAGFLVDSASEILNIPSDKIEAPTEMVGGIHTDFIRGLVYLDTRFLVILDLDRVLTASEQELIDLKMESPGPETGLPETGAEAGEGRGYA